MLLYHGIGQDVFYGDTGNMSKQIDPSLLERKIIHIDMDCFYAAVEMRDDPKLREVPVIVGGDPNGRGVVSTANYVARKYGIRSAMACSTARRLCPKAIFLKPNFEKYRTVSGQIHSIFSRYTSLVEPVSLDEAYLDVTNNDLNYYASKIGRLIKEEILRATGLTASAGIGPNKLIAKIASDFNKPDGITVVLPTQSKDFMGPLSLRKIPGVGPATEKRLKEHGWSICAHIWPVAAEELEEKLGQRMATWLYHRARGIDRRGVVSHRERKSLGHEETFPTDIMDINTIKEKITKISLQVSKGLKNKNLSGKTITLKIKYKDFTTITRSQTSNHHLRDAQEIMEIGIGLLRKTQAGKIPIRLIGVAASNLI